MHSPSQLSENWLRNAPAGLKLGLALGSILGLGALPAEHAWWGLCVAPPLLVLARLANVSWLGLLRALLLALPVLAGVALLVFVQRGPRVGGALLVKSSMSVLILRVLSQTTPISELMRTLRRWHVPEVLCTTIALLHRYLFLLTDESTRMRRARAGRTLRGGRLGEWRASGAAIGLLFVRTVSRAERVHAAMRSRGGA